MPELANRGDTEARFARALGRAGSRAAQLVEAALEGAADAGALTGEVWDAVAQEYASVLLGELEGVFVAGAQGQIDAVGIGVDFDVINTRAADYARTHTYDLVRGITDNSRRQIQQAVGDYFSQQMTQRDLQARISRTFGPVRASQIAVTEVTRAASHGEIAVNQALQQLGLKPVLVWRTNADDRTCVLCSPLDGKQQGDGWTNPPPIHVNCRCWMSTEFEE